MFAFRVALPLLSYRVEKHKRGPNIEANRRLVLKIEMWHAPRVLRWTCIDEESRPSVANKNSWNDKIHAQRQEAAHTHSSKCHAMSCPFIRPIHLKYLGSYSPQELLDAWACAQFFTPATHSPLKVCVSECYLPISRHSVHTRRDKRPSTRSSSTWPKKDSTLVWQPNHRGRWQDAWDIVSWCTTKMMPLALRCIHAKKNRRNKKEIWTNSAPRVSW